MQTYRTAVLVSLAPITATSAPGSIAVPIEVNGVELEGEGIFKNAALFMSPLQDSEELWIDFYSTSGTRIKIADTIYTTQEQDMLVHFEIDANAGLSATLTIEEAMDTARSPVPRDLTTRYEHRAGWTSLGRLSPEETAMEL